MGGLLRFNDTCFVLSPSAPPYQRADDVGLVVTEFLWRNGRPFYPISALTEARCKSVRLSQGRFEPTDEDNLDLVFRLPASAHQFYFEIVLRTHEGTHYGGALYGEDCMVTEEIIAAHYVLHTRQGQTQRRYVYSPVAGQYIADIA